jgi:predicted nucleotidyltransferase
MNEEEVERKSLEDLESVLREARDQGIRLVIIGGYAVAAYTRGYRFTKDIDLVADKPTLGKLMGLLKTLRYVIRDTEFGIAGNKKLNDALIDLHISVGRIYDISTGKEYPVNALLFRNAKNLTVKGYISKTTSLRATVVELETLIILKTMPVGRDKDAVDLLSLLQDKRKELRLDVIVDRAKSAGLTKHLLERIRDYAERLRQDELDVVWFNMTGTRLPFTEKREIGRFLARFAQLLRQQSP